MCSVTLNNIIQRNFPEEYAERKAEMEAVTLAGEEILPLFVMDVVLPCEKMPLNIFEPRYRLMVNFDGSSQSTLVHHFLVCVLEDLRLSHVQMPWRPQVQFLIEFWLGPGAGEENHGRQPSHGHGMVCIC